MGSPDFSWDAMLKLELISNADINLFLAKGMRGRLSHISYISKRFNKANNEYLKSYISKQESKHIIYLNTNNLYGYALPKFLPAGKFKWINPSFTQLNTAEIVGKVVL